MVLRLSFLALPLSCHHPIPGTTNPTLTRWEALDRCHRGSRRGVCVAINPSSMPFISPASPSREPPYRKAKAQPLRKYVGRASRSSFSHSAIPLPVFTLCEHATLTVKSL
nr:hypothetical protein CFP56_72620 [Quercus suber]